MALFSTVKDITDEELARELKTQNAIGTLKVKSQKIRGSINNILEIECIFNAMDESKALVPSLRIVLTAKLIFYPEYLEKKIGKVHIGMTDTVSISSY